jgi:hypothetical protein
MYPNSASERMGADSGAVLERWSGWSRLKTLRMGMAVDEWSIFSPDGEGDRPTGEAMDDGCRKSSRFMGSPGLEME